MRLPLLGLCVALTIVGCGESNDESTTEQSTEPNCVPSTTGDPASTTTTLDLRCVVVATETSTTTAAAQAERWEGPVTGEQSQPACEPPSLPVTGEASSLVVDADGTVTGSATERRDSFSCGGTLAPAFEQTYQITGRKTSTAFELSVSGREITLPITGTQATATFDNQVPGGYGAIVTYTADCVNC